MIIAGILTAQFPRLYGHCIRKQTPRRRWDPGLPGTTIPSYCRAHPDLVDAVCKLGHSFGLEVIGEGVSSEISRRLAVDLGCNYLQGYYLGRPLDLIQLQQAVDKTPNETEADIVCPNKRGAPAADSELDTP